MVVVKSQPGGYQSCSGVFKQIVLLATTGKPSRRISCQRELECELRRYSRFRSLENATKWKGQDGCRTGRETGTHSGLLMLSTCNWVPSRLMYPNADPANTPERMTRTGTRHPWTIFFVSKSSSCFTKLQKVA